jgi:hypothetical protein
MNLTSNPNRKLLAKAAAAALVIMLSPVAVNATPITVPNASFESPSSPTQTSTNPNIATGWVFNVKGGSAYGTSSISSNFTSAVGSSGNNYAFINNDSPNVTDTITSAASLGTITPLTKYTLTVAIGNRNGSGLYHDPGNVSFSLLANGVAFATDTVSNGTVADGTFEDFALTYTTPASGSIIGENLELQLAALPEQSNAFQPSFDNVTLDATSIVVPEPGTGALLLSGLLTLCWLVRRKRVGLETRTESDRSLALRTKKCPIRLAFIVLFVVTLGFASAHAQAIKSFPLDEHTIYHLKVGTDKVTTLVFPEPITALESSGITVDPKIRAEMMLSYHAGDRFLSVRSLLDPAAATLNVIINRKVYVIELATDKEPFQSVTFYPADEPPAQSVGQPNVGPSRLLGLLDKAKAYPLLAEQYPEMVSQIDKAEPLTRTLYRGFEVILTKVFRFDAEDALIFQVEFVNETDQPISYVPQSLAVRVGSGVYWSALSDASGIIAAGEKDPKTGKITPGHSTGYFVICGTPHGGRNHLSVQNSFNVLVFRPENNS